MFVQSNNHPDPPSRETAYECKIRLSERQARCQRYRPKTLDDHGSNGRFPWGGWGRYGGGKGGRGGVS